MADRWEIYTVQFGEAYGPRPIEVPQGFAPFAAIATDAQAEQGQREFTVLFAKKVEA